ncbi:MAG: hypothetical protein KatS3mg102_0217 [Planctomycetota bacterium]|nr:MAG: hypothetical protein KatS3mg102_0217 [Planctomycetota bacterium]
MLLEWLSRVRGRLGGSALARALRRLGLRELVLGPYERAILRRGTHRLRVAGQLVRFAVADRAELAWLDWFRRIEGPFVDRLLRALRPGEVLFDVGANVGVVSVLAAVVGRPAGVAVHAFEPQKELAERIAANARLNGCTHSIRVHALALGRQRGRLPLYPHADNPGAASLVPGAWHRAEPRWVPVERG